MVEKEVLCEAVDMVKKYLMYLDGRAEEWGVRESGYTTVVDGELRNVVVNWVPSGLKDEMVFAEDELKHWEQMLETADKQSQG